MGALGIHDHVLPSSQDVSLVEIAAVHHVHRLHILVIVVNSLIVKFNLSPLILGITAGIGTAVYIGDLVLKGLLGPLHLVQGKIIALPHIIYPVTNGYIGLGNTHILV